MKNVLVTGAGGYIGIPLCESLLQDGHNVIGFDRFFFGREVLAHLESHGKFKALAGGYLI